jgi:hypothetical protein
MTANIPVGCARQEIVAGLTRTEFEAIPGGSTKEEVRRKCGSPFMEVVQVSSDRTSPKEQLHWCYGKRASWRGTHYSFPMLTFVDGKLESRAWDEAAQDAQMIKELEEMEREE